MRLPSGTVTLLFTDVVGSTRLLEELGVERYSDALMTHRALIRQACSRGGHEVDTQGDSFLFAFADARSAVDAAVTARAQLAAGPIRIRSGLHTGILNAAETGYVGMDVHIGARVAAAGHAEQILLTDATAALVDREDLKDLGDHRFRDIPRPIRVYQVGATSHPPLTSLYRSNLPVPSTALVGRRREVQAIAGMLRSREQRLLTLTGPGGIGKTRLALAVAAELHGDFPDGRYWIPLAPVRPPADLVDRVLQAIGTSGRSLDVIRGSPLLILDNAEHLLPQVARLVADLLQLDGPRLLVTSRERLGVAGERVYPVDGLKEREAVKLFAARVRDLRPRARIEPSVNALCNLLDRLPLAIELVAAQSSVYTASQLLERVGARLDLAHSDRLADDRQRTLRATIAWSYDLLTVTQQAAFRMLSTFAGGFTLEAADAVGVSSNTVAALLDKSLVRRVWGSPGVRFLMLETIRDFAAERAIATGDAERAARLHAEHFAAITDRIWNGRLLPAPADLEAEVPNLGAALAWARKQGPPDLVIRLISGVLHVWDRGRVPDIRQSLEEALVVTTEPVIRARGLNDLAWELFRSGQRSAARRAASEAHACAVRLDHPRLLAQAENMLSVLDAARGDLASAFGRGGRALEHYRVAGHRLGEANTLANLGDIALIAGDLTRSADHSRAAIALYEGLGEETVSLSARLNLATALLGLNEIREAEALVRQALAEVQQLSDGYSAPAALQLAADICLRHGDPASAARLVGAADSLMEELGAAYEPSSQQHHDALMRQLDGWGGGGPYGEGSRLDFTGAIELALQRLA